MSNAELLPETLARALGPGVAAGVYSSGGAAWASTVPDRGRTLEEFRASVLPGHLLLERPVGVNGDLLALEAPVDRIEWMQPLVEHLSTLLQDLGQLQEDMDSIYVSSLAQMEAVAKLTEVVQQISTCHNDEELASLSLQSLAVATSVERASFVRCLPQAGCFEIFAEFVPDPATNGYRLDESRSGTVFHARSGFLAEILGGRPTAILSGDEARAQATPNTPGASAREQVLAVPVRYGNDVASEIVGAIVLTDPRANQYSEARKFGSQESELALNVASVLGGAVGQRRFAVADRELKLANEIQQQILPQEPARLKGFDLAGRCETPGAIGGDYFDFVTLSDGRLLVFIADVSGHNLASGMVMVGARAALRLLAGRESEPAAVLTGLHDSIYGDLARTERFITAAGAALEAESGSLELINAGHNPPLCFRADTGEVEQLEGEDPILGLVPGVEFSCRSVALCPGDVLLLYTDGATEATSPSGEMFEEKRLGEVLQRCAGQSAAVILDNVFSSVRVFADQTDAGDDITAVVIKYLGESKP